MPYIKKNRRSRLDPAPKSRAETAGELNYQLTQLCRLYLSVHGECYQTYNDILGALTGAQLEIYRRKISGYEDVKCMESGDVY